MGMCRVQVNPWSHKGLRPICNLYFSPGEKPRPLMWFWISTLPRLAHRFGHDNHRASYAL